MPPSFAEKQLNRSGSFDVAPCPVAYTALASAVAVTSFQPSRVNRSFSSSLRACDNSHWVIFAPLMVMGRFVPVAVASGNPNWTVRDRPAVSAGVWICR